MVTVKEEALLACSVCLDVNTKLYDVRDCKLEDIFIALMGNSLMLRDGFPQHLCGYCRAQLLKCTALRVRCQRSQELLKRALALGQSITMDYLQTIDRVAHKLCLNLKTYNVYNSDSTQLHDTIKLEDLIKEETNDFIENIFVEEPTVLDFDDSDINNDNEVHYESSKPIEPIEDDFEEKNITRNGKNNRVVSKNTCKTKTTGCERSKKTNSTRRIKVKSTRTRKTLESTKDTSNKRNTDSTEKTKRIIKRRMADNGFLPDFNFDEFQSKYNVKIDILTKEEQLREIEARKMSSTYTLSAFGCEICGKAFASKPVYDVHMMKHNVSAGAHSCEVCHMRFKTRSRVHVHQDTHRLRFTCERCGFLTRTRFIAKNHFLSHTGTTHKCPHCDAVFNKYTSYLTHVRRRHPAMNAACDECGETFVGANGLRHHKTRAHRHGTISESQFKCSTCDAHFVSSQALERHTNSAPEGDCDLSMRACAQCGEGLRSEEQLRAHEETHAAPARVCQECNKSFVDARSFDTHYARVHLNIRLKEPPRAKTRPVTRFICELCGTECTSLTNLTAHQRSHTGDKPHPCPACALRFRSVHNMRRHHRVLHLGQRPEVKCTICGKLLAHASSLKLHVNTVHLKLPVPPRQRRRKEDTK